LDFEMIPSGKSALNYQISAPSWAFVAILTICRAITYTGRKHQHIMIIAQSVSHYYSQDHPLSFKDWQIAEAEQWLLLGDSGSGKTTLINIISGLLKPSSGKVIIKDTDIYQLKGKDRDHFRGQHIGIIFQKPHIIKSLTIMENLVIAQSFALLKEDKRRVEEVLESLGIAHKKNAYPNELSYGQLQRVSIARAVINKPTLVIADEPTSSLDDRNAEAVITLLAEQSRINGSTLVVSTHDQRVKDSFDKKYIL